MIFSNKRITKVLISLCICTGWSAPLLLADPDLCCFDRPPKTGFLASRPKLSKDQYKTVIGVVFTKYPHIVLRMDGQMDESIFIL